MFSTNVNSKAVDIKLVIQREALTVVLQDTEGVRAAKILCQLLLGGMFRAQDLLVYSSKTLS